MRVWDADGKMYYDFLAGLGVNNLGHCHPRVVEAIRQQAGTLLHVSNLYHIQPQIELADMLAQMSFADRSFFCNSGTESCEAAMKLARKYSTTTSVRDDTKSSPSRTPSMAAPWGRSRPRRSTSITRALSRCWRASNTHHLMTCRP